MRALPSLAFAAILACAALPARADYMIGFEAFRIEEYGVAHSELLPAAEAGDGGAAIILALLYANGYGRPADRAAALHWFEEAAHTGDIAARAMAGALTGIRRNAVRECESSLVWLTEAASSGDAREIGRAHV